MHNLFLIYDVNNRFAYSTKVGLVLCLWNVFAHTALLSNSLPCDSILCGNLRSLELQVLSMKVTF